MQKRGDGLRRLLPCSLELDTKGVDLSEGFENLILNKDFIVHFVQKGIALHFNLMTTYNRDPEDGYHDLGEDTYYGLPPYPRTRRQTCCSFSWPIVTVTSILIILVGFIATATFVFWPTQADVKITNWKLNGITIDTKESESILPAYQLNVSLDLLVEIVNPNYAGLKYDTLTVRIDYRGDEIGEVQSEGAMIKARSAANHTATFNLEGDDILDNAKDLVVDISKRKVPLTTYTTIDGALQLWFIKPLIQVGILQSFVKGFVIFRV